MLKNEYKPLKESVLKFLESNDTNEDSNGINQKACLFNRIQLSDFEN